jgi:peptidoglycan/LPS O-acetylase OafA/YrhL
MDRHRDNIGVLRLILASLVIVGHAPEMLDGDRHREPLTMLFHTISLGELAVDAFFLISGYLITMSWIRSKSFLSYLERRILRIYPGFVVASLISVFVLGPLVGSSPQRILGSTLAHIIGLQPPPNYSGQLEGLHYPLLNGSMWTIAYEFRAYMLVATLGIIGVLHSRRMMLLLALGLIALLVGATFHTVRAPLDALAAHHRRVQAVLGDPWADIRLNAAFFVGANFYLWRDKVLPRLTAKVALVAAIATAVLLFRDPHLAETALITFGATAMFWIAFRAELGSLQRVNDSWDISYGVYLYGWPIATAIIWLNRAVTPVELISMTLPLAALAGAASWWGVEKWTKDLVRSRATSRGAAVGQSIKSGPSD